jgi:hypothetical protein
MTRITRAYPSSAVTENHDAVPAERGAINAFQFDRAKKTQCLVPRQGCLAEWIASAAAARHPTKQP